MSLLDRLQRLRGWFPVPGADGRIHAVRWILLEGNRNAVTAALLSFVFVSLVTIGSLWTFEMARVVTETPAIQTILNTDRKSTRLNSSHVQPSRMPSSA